MENAIEKAISDYNTSTGNSLTNQDVFYREVSKIHRGLQELVNCCEDSAHSDLSPTQIAQVVHDTNEIILVSLAFLPLRNLSLPVFYLQTVLNEVVQYRNQNADNFTPSEAVKSLDLDYLPWTAANGSEGVMDSLILQVQISQHLFIKILNLNSFQHSLTVNYGLKLINEGQLRNSLLDHFVALTDLILDGRKCHLESVKGTPRENVLYKQYTSDRHKLIKPLCKSFFCYHNGVAT